MTLVVLEDMVVFVGGIFERVKSPNIFLEKFIESKKTCWHTKKYKNPLDKVKNPH